MFGNNSTTLYYAEEGVKGGNTMNTVRFFKFKHAYDLSNV